MRLIDADKLENDITENVTTKAVSRVVAILQGQPTVKAIPIEWLRNYYRQRYGGGIGFTQTMTEKMIQAWEQESEGRDTESIK